MTHTFREHAPPPICTTIKMSMDPPLDIRRKTLLCLIRGGKCKGRFEAVMTTDTNMCLKWIPPAKSKWEGFLQWIHYHPQDLQPVISADDMLINLGELHEEGKSVPEAYSAKENNN